MSPYYTIHICCVLIFLDFPYTFNLHMPERKRALQLFPGAEFSRIEGYDLNSYLRARNEMRGIISELTESLGNIFQQRKKGTWDETKERIRQPTQAGYRRPFDGATESQNSSFSPEDYSITLLVDLSSSMRDYNKLDQTFKGTVILAETLNNLGINTEILGFNRYFYEFKSFQEPLSDSIRGKIGTMPEHIHRRTDLGFALQGASNRLEQQRRPDGKPLKGKFIITLTDGKPYMPEKDRSSYILSDTLPAEEGGVLDRILNTNQKVIGLGLGKGTEYVRVFPHSAGNISPQDLPEVMENILHDIIALPNRF